MKILHFIEGIQNSAGTTAFVVRVSEYLAKVGHEVVIVVRVKESEDARPVGVRVVACRTVRMLEWRSDVVQIHGLWVPWLHEAQQWAEGCGIPVIRSPHGALAPWAMAYKRWKKFLPWWLYQRRDIARATVIHATASPEAAWIRAFRFKNPIVEVPLGTDLPERPALHDGSIKILLFVGRIHSVKGLDLLLKAWVLTKNKGAAQGWHLVCVGPDQAGYMAELEHLALSLDLSVRHGGVAGAEDADLTFTGPLYGVAKDEAYRVARGLILPSYTENFGGVVVDALAFGLPVLTSTATPWEYLNRKGCGLSFELKVTALVAVLEAFFVQTDDQRKAMGLLGQDLVAKCYTWDAIGQKMMDVYSNMLGIEG